MGSFNLKLNIHLQNGFVMQPTGILLLKFSPLKLTKYHLLTLNAWKNVCYKISTLIDIQVDVTEAVVHTTKSTTKMVTAMDAAEFNANLNSDNLDNHACSRY